MAPMRSQVCLLFCSLIGRELREKFDTDHEIGGEEIEDWNPELKVLSLHDGERKGESQKEILFRQELERNMEE